MARLQDDAEWHRFASDQGYANAQYNLGVVYLTGTGVPQDHGEAARWHQLAADHAGARPTSGGCTGSAMGSRRTMPSHPGGAGSPPARGMPTRSPTSG